MKLTETPTGQSRIEDQARETLERPPMPQEEVQLRVDEILATIDQSPPAESFNSAYNTISEVYDKTEDLAQVMLPQASTFTSAREGLRIDTDLLGSTLAGLLTVRERAEEKWLNIAPISSIFEKADRAVLDNFGKLLETSTTTRINRGSIAERNLKPILQYAEYAVASGSLYLCADMIRRAQDHGCMDVLLEGETAEQLMQSPAWHEAMFRTGFTDSLRSALGEGRLLTEQEKKPVHLVLGNYGFGAAEANQILRSSLSLHKDDISDERQSQVKVAQLEKNIKAIGELAKISPELPKKLHTIFGICNFDRYDPSALEAQTKPGYQPDAIAVTGTSDWNGAFQRWGESAQGVAEAPLFVEVSNNAQLARRFVTLKQAGISVSHIIVGAHGNEERVSWSHYDGPGGNRFSKEFIEKSKGLRRLVQRGLITPGCRVTIRSCNTGHKGAVAERIAELPGIGPVQAPDFKSHGMAKAPDGSNGLIYFSQGSEEARGEIYDFSD